MGWRRRDDDASFAGGARQSQQFRTKTLMHIEVDLLADPIVESTNSGDQRRENLVADIGMAVDRLAEPLGGHAGDNRVGDRQYARRSRTPVDRGEFAKIFAVMN